MTLAERNISRSIARFPWESSLVEESVREEDVGSEQAGFETGMFFDCMLGLTPRMICVSPDELESSFRFLRFLSSASDAMIDLQQVSDYDIWNRKEKDHATACLEDAAKARDERTFLKALQEVKWHNRPPGDFIYAAQLALKAGAYRAAYQISAEGAEHHPSSSEIQKYAHVLAPPKVVVGKATTDSGHKANREWLKTHGGEYSGQWVAVRNGELLGASGSLEELAKQVGDTKNVLLTKAL